MSTAVSVTSRIVKFLKASPIPGYIVAFDGDIFMGILPVQNWETCIQDTLHYCIYDTFCIITTSELSDDTLSTALKLAAALGMTYEGSVHAAGTPSTNFAGSLG